MEACKYCDQVTKTFAFISKKGCIDICEECLLEKHTNEPLVNINKMNKIGISCCKTCNTIQTLDLFPKGVSIFNICKKCVAAKQRVKVACGICNNLYSYGNLNKHMHTHNNTKIVCDCGKVLKPQCVKKHILSKKHIKEVSLLKAFIPIPATEISLDKLEE